MSSLLYSFFGTKLSTIKSGKGLYLIDSQNKKYFDFTGGSTGHAVIGYSNSKVINSITKQAKKICHIDYKYFDDSNRKKLADIIIKKNTNNLNKVYFVGSSGAEACEASIKLSYQVHYSNNLKNKKIYISRRQSYHGCSSQSLALGDRPNLYFYKNILNNNVKKVSEHNYLRNKKKNETEEEYSLRCAKELEKKIISIGPDNIGGFVAETMQGGLVGDVPPSKNYWKLVRKICDKYNMHLILDEVWCGTGVSGKYFCIDYDKITPDFVFLSKTLAGGYGALSAIITKNELFKNVEKKFGQILYSNTHQGHSLSIAAALQVQKIINNKDFLKNVFDKGVYLRNVIKSELKDHEFFFDVRGRGLRNSFEYNCYEKNYFGNYLKKILKERYQILIDAKWHRICFSPSLTITKKEIDKNLMIIVDQFKKIAKDWSKRNIKQVKFKYF